MILCQAVSGVFTTNCYFYIDETTKSGFLIDPGAEANLLLQIIQEHHLTIEQILLTHGHFDHFGAAKKIQETLDIPISMYKDGKIYVENPTYNLSGNCGVPMTLSKVNYLTDQTKIISKANPNFYLELRHIPGHTLDSSIYYNPEDQVAFVGDTIFNNAMALTNFWGGDFDTWIKNVCQEILTLPAATILLSGHTDQTTVGAELQRPWYQEYLQKS